MNDLSLTTRSKISSGVATRQKTRPFRLKLATL